MTSSYSWLLQMSTSIWCLCWGVFYRICRFYLEGVWLWRISGGY